MTNPTPAPTSEQEEWRRLASRYRRGPAGYVSDKATTEAIALLKELHPVDWLLLLESRKAVWAERVGYTPDPVRSAARQHRA